MAAETQQASTTERVAGAAHHAVDAAAERSARAENRIRETGHRAAERSQEMRDTVGDYVNQHPVASLGIAVAAGFILGSLIRR